jgi:hypothetical protein
MEHFPEYLRLLACYKIPDNFIETEDSWKGSLKPLDSILSQLNPVLILRHYFLILLFMLRPELPNGSQTENFVQFSHTFPTHAVE